MSLSFLSDVKGQSIIADVLRRLRPAIPFYKYLCVEIKKTGTSIAAAKNVERWTIRNIIYG